MHTLGPRSAPPSLSAHMAIVTGGPELAARAQEELAGCVRAPPAAPCRAPAAPCRAPSTSCRAPATPCRSMVCRVAELALDPLAPSPQIELAHPLRHRAKLLLGLLLDCPCSFVTSCSLMTSYSLVCTSPAAPVGVRLHCTVIGPQALSNLTPSLRQAPPPWPAALCLASSAELLRL